MDTGKFLDAFKRLEVLQFTLPVVTFLLLKSSYFSAKIPRFWRLGGLAGDESSCFYEALVFRQGFAF
jgi:hypothetical protein